MDQLLPIFWLILGILFTVFEVFTLGFVLLWFGIGAFAAAIAGFLGVGILGQFLIFAIVSTVLTFMSRTIFEKYLPDRGGADLKTGIENMPGSMVEVIEGNVGKKNNAVVSALGSRWNALPEHTGEEFETGERVEIVRIDGSSVYVRKAGKKLSGWRE